MHPGESKSFSDKPKHPIVGRLGGDKGKNRTRKSEKLFGLNILVENLVAMLKERYEVRDPAPLNPQNKGTRDKVNIVTFTKAMITIPKIIFICGE